MPLIDIITIGASLIGLGACTVTFSTCVDSLYRIQPKNRYTIEGILLDKYIDHQENFHARIIQEDSNNLDLYFETNTFIPPNNEKNILTKLSLYPPMKRPFYRKADVLANTLQDGSYIKIKGFYEGNLSVRVTELLETKPTPATRDYQNYRRFF